MQHAHPPSLRMEAEPLHHIEYGCDQSRKAHDPYRRSIIQPTSFPVVQQYGCKGPAGISRTAGR